MGPICVDGVISLTLSSLFLLPPFSFSFFLRLFSLSVFYFFLPLFGSFFLPFFGSGQFRCHHQSDSLETPRPWSLVLGFYFVPSSNVSLQPRDQASLVNRTEPRPEIKLCQRIGLSLCRIIRPDASQRSEASPTNRTEPRPDHETWCFTEIGSFASKSDPELSFSFFFFMWWDWMLFFFFFYFFNQTHLVEGCWWV